MRQTGSHLMRAALACTCFLTMTAGWAQENMPAAPDPARWYVDDDSAQARLRTLRKEIGAAFKQAQAECRSLPASDRRTCLKEARDTYRDDMANAEQLRDNAPK
jgi:hypothetical protein